MTSQLIILQVIVPLISAPFCVLFRNARLAWLIALVVSWITFAIAIMILGIVIDQGPVSYLLGNWQVPWGIEYKVDLIGAILLVLVSAIAAVIMPYALKSVEKEIERPRIYLFYTMLLLCLAGLLGIAVTGDAFNLFVFLEISSLSTYVLVSMGKNRRALTASFHYLIMGTTGATFYIIGVGLMYMITGTLNMSDLATLIPAVADNRTIQVALAFILVGLGIKLAMFPLHAWLPNAYTYAPSVVSVFLASTATKIAIYVLVRMVFTIFGKVEILDILPIRYLIMGLAIIAMFSASLIAIFQVDLKRMLAFSSLAQIGYILLGLSFDSITGLSAGIVHLFNHGLMKGALFMVAGAVYFRFGSTKLEQIEGLGKTMPWTMAAFVVAGLSMIGVPLTVGFVSKWYLMMAAFEQGYWPIAMLIVLSSLLAVIYVWRVVELAYFREPAATSQLKGGIAKQDPPLSMLIPMWVLSLATVYFGIDATRTMDIALIAASSLKGMMP